MNEEFDDEEAPETPEKRVVAEEAAEESAPDRTGIKRQQREQIATDVGAFLASGKKPTTVPNGETGFEFISKYANKASKFQTPIGKGY